MYAFIAMKAVTKMAIEKPLWHSLYFHLLVIHRNLNLFHSVLYYAFKYESISPWNAFEINYSKHLGFWRHLSLFSVLFQILDYLLNIIENIE